MWHVEPFKRPKSAIAKGYYRFKYALIKLYGIKNLKKKN